MGRQLTAEDARLSLTAHVAAKGKEVFARHGPRFDWDAMLHLLSDRNFVRYPCEVKFDADPLADGEMAYAAPKGAAPEDGYTLYVHPVFMLDLPRVPFLVLYQLVVVNYGALASSDDAEVFAAAALGLSRELYYSALCEMADTLAMYVPSSADVVEASRPAGD